MSLSQESYDMARGDAVDSLSDMQFEDGGHEKRGTINGMASGLGRG